MSVTGSSTQEISFFIFDVFGVKKYGTKLLHHKIEKLEKCDIFLQSGSEDKRESVPVSLHQFDRVS